MFKFLIILPFLFVVWFGFVKIFSKNEESLINVLTKNVFSDFSMVLRNIFNIFDSLFKNFIQTYELLGLVFKRIVEIFKSLISTFVQFINLFKVIGITLMSFISLCKGLYKETKNISLFNNFKTILSQNTFAKNSVVKLFTFKRDDLNNKKVSLK